MSFLENLKQEANTTTTLNGAKTYKSTGDACLDFFSVAGGMRYRRPQDQISSFDRAYIETPELAMKLLFHIRDIRGGMGERELFRTLIRHVAKVWPKSAKKNVHLIAKFGRWDDLMCLMGTPAQSEVVKVIQEQLKKDLDAYNRRQEGEIDAPISLLAKWLPSCNTSSARTRGQAKVLMNALKMDTYSYRKMLSTLRRQICITEGYLTRQEASKICYKAVPAGAMLKYRSAFEKHDEERFLEYVEHSLYEKSQMHSDTLFPYQVLKPYFDTKSYWGGINENVSGAKVLEALWENFTTEIGTQNAISVIDVSGSMYWGNAPIKPILMAMSLGLYCAERCNGAFRNHFITFSSYPELVEIKGDTLYEKIASINRSNCGCSTDLEAVFDLILQTAVNTNAKQEEMPSTLYIFSDMEFDMAISNPNKTVYENAKRQFEVFGYQLPAVVFHNVNSWQMQAPVTAHTKGTALVSGASTASLKEKFDGNITPMEHMLRVLNSKRYEEVHA